MLTSAPFILKTEKEKTMAISPKQTQFDELEDIKKLLILLLLKMGTPQKEIAVFLKVDQGNFSRMYPARKIKKIPS
jgi:hypothetical protein